ncbi:hypothetical protein GCM10010214_03190 [Streptomyces abikoensis]|nr:hypothetical protein GCM10010214_03190 [Streptomyces abikoensis]
MAAQEAAEFAVDQAVQRGGQQQGEAEPQADRGEQTEAGDSCRRTVRQCLERHTDEQYTAPGRASGLRGDSPLAEAFGQWSVEPTSPATS